MAYLVGEALMQAAAALPDSVLKQAPLLENIGLNRLAESEQGLQAYEIRYFSPIQLWDVYLNVYQLLDFTLRNGMARITNTRY